MKEKIFKIPKESLETMIEFKIAGIASDSITVDGNLVGYMYREEAEKNYDSGWRFFSGLEDQAYVDDENNLSYYKLNTIANYDPSILPFLDSPVGSSFEKNDQGEFVTIEEEDEDDN
jgi:hypothetical protein